jgi:hypothetical protein
MEDWTRVRIDDGRTPTLSGPRAGAYGLLGATELFFEGAEPSLDEVLSRTPGSVP